jgi:hypothetical protein
VATILLAHATFVLAQSTSDNAAGGALLSLWFPLGLFIVVAAILWVIYARPHDRVPPRPAAHAHGASSVASAGPAAGGDSNAQPPQPGTDDTGPQQ